MRPVFGPVHSLACPVPWTGPVRPKKTSYDSLPDKQYIDVDAPSSS